MGNDMDDEETSAQPASDGAGVIPGSRTPLARILAQETDYFTCISTAEQRPGWTLFHNKNLIGRLDPNHAGDFRAAEGTGETIAHEIIAFYQAVGGPPTAYVDALARPRDLAMRLLQAGFQEWPGATADLMLYVGPDDERASPAAVDIVRTDQEKADWATVVAEEATTEERQLLHRQHTTEISDPRMTAYLARVDGRPASRCELLSSKGLGRVEAVRTLARYRRHGLAAAVVRQAVLDSLARGNEITYIYAEPGGQAQRLYERLGFRTVATKVIRGFIWWG